MISSSSTTRTEPFLAIYDAVGRACHRWGERVEAEIITEIYWKSELPRMEIDGPKSFDCGFQTRARIAGGKGDAEGRAVSWRAGDSDMT